MVLENELPSLHRFLYYTLTEQIPCQVPFKHWKYVSEQGRYMAAALKVQAD